MHSEFYFFQFDNQSILFNRSLKAAKEEETTLNGIEVYRFLASQHNFDSEKTNPNNICRCRKNEDEPTEPPKCLKDGAIDATKCQGDLFKICNFIELITILYKPTPI